MTKQKEMNLNGAEQILRGAKLVSFFDEANLSAGIMKKQETPSVGIINSVGYFVLPIFITNYYCTHENVLTRMAENIVIFGGAAALIATVYVGWKELVAEGQKMLEEKYDRCFKNGRYPYPQSNAEGRKEFEEYCLWKYGELPEIKHKN